VSRLNFRDAEQTEVSMHAIGIQHGRCFAEVPNIYGSEPENVILLEKGIQVL